jgi:hypothetical protein
MLNALCKAGIVLMNGGSARWSASAPLLVSAAAIGVMLAAGASL